MPAACSLALPSAGEASGNGSFDVESIVNPRKLEHGFRRISARIPYTLP